MADTTQSAVEAMAWAIDSISDARSENPDDYALLDNPRQCARAALTAFLAHLTASGWQIVPVVATFGEDQMSWAGAMEIPTDIGRGGAGRMACQIYTAMLAAAPQRRSFRGGRGDE